MLALVAGLSACGPRSEPAAVSTTRVYAIDQSGAARQCTVSPVTPAAGKEAGATIAVRNDGGWCAIKLHQEGPKPYDAGLLTSPPAHGRVYIHIVGDDTRIDYTPDAGYAGPDAFTVSLLPGRAVIRASVTVSR